MILLLSLFFTYTTPKVCKLDFLSAYGLDGEEKPQIRKMLLCSSIQFSCCTIFDELKFHKKWYDYYEPKIQLSHEKAVSYYTRLAEAVSYFKNFNWQNRESLVKTKLAETKNLILNIEKIQLDEQLRPILNDFPQLLEFETKVKKGFVCMLCDYSNHEYFSAKNNSLMVKENFCNRLVNIYGPFLQKRALLLNPLLIDAYKVMNHFKGSYLKRDIQSIKDVIKQGKAVKRCFKNNEPYDFERCRDLCNNYSISSLSPVFYGEFSFYMRFLDRFEKFKNWLENIKEEKPKDEKENTDKKIEQTQNKTTGRLLEAKNIKFKRKINRISKSLKDYKKIIKNLRRYNNNYLKKIYHNSRKLARKRRQLGNVNGYIDYGNIYGLYNRNLQAIQALNTQTTQNVNSVGNLQTNQQIVMPPVNNLQTNQNSVQQPAQQTVQQSQPNIQQSVQQPNLQQPVQQPNVQQPTQQSVQQPVVQQPAQQPNVQQPTQPPSQTPLSQPSIQPNSQNINPSSVQPIPQNQQTNQTPITQPSVVVNNQNTMQQPNGQNLTANTGQAQQIMVDPANDPKLGNSNCTSGVDAFKCKNSVNVKNSTNIVDSANITNSENVTLSIEVSNSFNIFNVTNCTNSLNITNSTNVIESVRGSDIRNVTKCEDCINVVNSTNCTNCRNCTNVHNCTNCVDAFNVTDGFNIKNVTNSKNVDSVINGTELFNVTDSKNVTMLNNAINMTNAKNCTFCQHNYNCTGKVCLIPRIEGGELKRKIKEIIYKHSEKIIDRLYSLFKTGGINGYKSDSSAFDPQIYRAASLYNDFDRFQYTFDSEGVLFENGIGASFVPEADKIKSAALTELLIEKNSEEISIVTERKSDALRNKLAEMAGFDLVYGFITDINRGVMNYDYIKGHLDDEIIFENEQDNNFEMLIDDEKIKIKEQEEENVKEGDKENTTNKSVEDNKNKDNSADNTSAQTEARKLIHVLKNRHKIKRIIN